MAIPEEDRNVLLRLARESVTAETEGLAGPPPPAPTGVMGERHGCFVTLTNRGRLRGCIGTFHPTKPLARQVIEMAAAAARDPRFAANPVTRKEVPNLKIQVSVLSELAPIANPLDLELGVHGIYVICGRSAGCFLPEVAAETGWTKEEFLSHCCEGKAGMSPDAWKDPQTKVFVFTSEKFSD
jgi:AmmeMemoRadiSam system protein A